MSNKPSLISDLMVDKSSLQSSKLDQLTLESWINLKEQSEDGFAPLLKSFLLENPEVYNPDLSEGDGVTLRSLSYASDILLNPSAGKPVNAALTVLLGKDIAERLHDHIKSNDPSKPQAPAQKPDGLAPGN